MFKRIPIKNHLQEIRLVTRRTITALIIMILLILVLVARLAYLQFEKHDLYTTLSMKNWQDIVPLEPTRGLIFDRNGVLLAENIPIFSLDIIPDKITSLPHTLSEVTKIIPLSDNDIAQFQRQLKQHRRFEEIPLKMPLTEEEVAKFAENQYKFKGVVVKARLMRHYPLDGLFIHGLGYVGRINTQELEEIDPTNYSGSNYIGKLGIEKYYEEELHGVVGYQQVENDASGEPVRIIKQINPVPGENLYLTIDTKLQMIVEESLGENRGAVIVVQPSTGQILALASTPTYDPNIFVNGVGVDEYKSLQEQPEKPLYNRALRGLYPLASTIKPYMALQGLNTGVADLRYTISDPGWFKLKNSSHIYHDWRKHGHGSVNLIKAIACSCDTYFFDLANRMGINRIAAGLRDFGFGQLTGIDLEEELPGNVATPEWKRRVKGQGWYPGDTVISGIGQGSMLATPLQLAMAVSTIANRGKRYAPYLLLASQEIGKPLTYQQPSLLYKIDYPEKNWKSVIQGMQNVILTPEGTGYRFGKDFPLPIAAKTGTAQVVAKRHRSNEGDHDDQSDLPEKYRDHSLFIAFSPVDNPKVAIAVVAENSLLASTIARKILDYYLLGPKTYEANKAKELATEDANEEAEDTHVDH